METRKRYVVRLNYGNWVDNLFLDGPDSQAQHDRLIVCLKQLKLLEESALDQSIYRTQALELFKGAGFEQIAK